MSRYIDIVLPLSVRKAICYILLYFAFCSMLSDSKVPSWDTLVSSTWLYSYFVLLSALIFILPYSLSFRYFKHCWGNNDDKDIPAVWTLTWADVFLRASLVAQLVKKSACNVGDLSSIPGSGRSPGEGIGYPLQYSWASLVAQMVKNPPAMQIWSLGGEDPLEEGMATHSSSLAWRIPMNRGAWRATVHGVAKSQTWLSD